MDKKFLNKVTEQIISETRIDYDRRIMGAPFFVPFPPSLSFLHPLSHALTLFLDSNPPLFFTKHCVEVYGLNEQEIQYVWKVYKKIIKDKIIKNGL